MELVAAIESVSMLQRLTTDVGEERRLESASSIESSLLLPSVKKVNSFS